MLAQEYVRAFKGTLLAGSYNLLLGSGISLDSKNSKGVLLRSAETLRRDLCTLKGLRDTTTLPRVYSLLSDVERAVELIEGYSRCQPGPSLKALPNYLWRRLFTFNIDDVVEALYGLEQNRKQELVPLNFDSSFEPAPDRRELQAVHLHGWVGQPDSGFVFSHAEYARVMQLNPWMHLLSEILATESFIIAGTSLNEVDLEYYLSFRSDATPRRGRGPSLLIDPYPDAATESDCRRYGLILVKAKFGEFLDWLQKECPAPPTVADLVIPDAGKIFPDKSLGTKLVRFFTDFRLLSAADKPKSTVPSPFLYGRAPENDDLDQHLDVSRTDNEQVQSRVERLLDSDNDADPKLITVIDDAGTGKTTTVRRVGHDLARSGQPVLTVHTLSRIDARNAAECLSTASCRVLLLVDGLADHADQIAELLQNNAAAKNVLILANERSYREEYIDLILGDVSRSRETLHEFRQGELRQVIELFRQYGLVGNAGALRNPDDYAGRLRGDPIAIAVCRILNDFRPLDVIVDSLWSEAVAHHRFAYLCTALARHCHVAGLRYSLLQSVVGRRYPLADLFTNGVPLGIAVNTEDDDYVVPINSVIGERILHRAATRERALMYEAFTGLAGALAPHVNRVAIMRRSPEARLAGRLFDGDKIVNPLLGDRAETFYAACQKEWAWNSRYWEQRALLAAVSDLDTGLQYARHATAIEFHPFPLTTLGKLLLMKMERDAGGRAGIFAEAMNTLSMAIQKEEYKTRITIHPYSTLFAGTVRYVELGETLSMAQRTAIKKHAKDARDIFGRDSTLVATLNRLDGML